jgi:hypothetical protein
MWQNAHTYGLFSACKNDSCRNERQVGFPRVRWKSNSIRQQNVTLTSEKCVSDKSQNTRMFLSCSSSLIKRKFKETLWDVMKHSHLHYTLKIFQRLLNLQQHTWFVLKGSVKIDFLSVFDEFCKNNSDWPNICWVVEGIFEISEVSGYVFTPAAQCDSSLALSKYRKQKKLNGFASQIPKVLTMVHKTRN